MRNDDKYLNAEGEFEGIARKPQDGWFQTSKDKGTPSIVVWLEVTGDDVDAGKLIKWHGWLTDKAFAGTVRRLQEVFGFDGDFDRLINGGSTFEGAPCRFTTEMESYEGKEKCKVKWLNNIQRQPRAALPEEEQKSFAAVFTKKAKAVLAETPAKSDLLPGEDDVPF